MLLAFELAVAALALASPLAAQQAAPEAQQATAQQLSADGMNAFKAGDYRAAIQDFSAARALSDAPLLIYNLAQAHRLAGDCPRAVALYREFLDRQPEGKARQLAEARLAELEPCLGSEAELDRAASRRPAATAPAPALETLHVAAGGPRPREPARVGGSGDGSKPERSATSNRTLALVSTGSAAALFGLSGYFAWRSARAADDVSDVFSNRGSWNDSLADRERGGQRDAKLSVASLVGGAVVAGVATWLWTFD